MKSIIAGGYVNGEHFCCRQFDGKAICWFQYETDGYRLLPAYLTGNAGNK